MSQIPIGNPQEPRKGERVMAKDISELWQAVKRLSDQYDYNPKSAFAPQKHPPLWVIMKKKAGADYEIYAQYGHVVPRHNASGDVGAPIEITSLPTKDLPVAADVGDYFWVKLDIDIEGKVTTATWETGTAWPEDVPPELIGGDDQTGTAGQRYIRIGEIITDPLRAHRTIVKQLHTGHIDYSQPELLENTITSASGDQGRILKQWNASAGRWDLRYLQAGDGIEIVESGDLITVNALGVGHPWKVTANGDDTVTIAAGLTLGIESESSPGLDTIPSFTLLKPIDIFNGSTVTVTGTGYIIGYSAYGVTPQIYSTSALTSVDAESVPISTGRITTGTGISVEFMAALPNGSVTGNFYFVIAEVSIVGGDAVVNRQVLYHNPTLDTYFADGT